MGHKAALAYSRPARLALPAGDRAQGVEAAGNGRQKPLLALHVGRDRAEDGRLLLVGAVGAAETLDRRVGLPARFQQIVDPLALVATAAIGVIAAPGAAGIGEDQDALVVIHEGGGLGEIRRSGAGLDAKPVAAPWPARLTIRRERPVTSATRSVPKRCRIWSSAPCTGGNGWSVWLGLPSEVRRTIGYIERNAPRAGLPGQRWPFVKAYDGWPFLSGHSPYSPYARRLREYP